MLNLSEVTSVLFHSSCAEYLIDGKICSQPVLSQGPNGLIDNFFVYSRNAREGTVFAPSVAFGIDAEHQTVVYVNSSVPIEQRAYRNIQTDLKGDFREFRKHYAELYSKVRACAFRTDCTPAQIRDVKEYCRCLETIAGSAAWVFYRILNPDFFAWADAL